MIPIRFEALILAAILLLPLAAADLNDDLFAATRKGDLAAVKALLDKGADVNAKGPYDQTPIFFAADRGHLEIVKLLAERGADLNRRDTFYNFTALGRAAMKSHKEIIRFLAEKGATGVGQLAMQAVFSDDKDLLQTLLETRKLTAKEMTSTLKVAEANKKPAMAEMLKAAGAKSPDPAITLDEATLNSYAGAYQGGRGGSEFDAVVTVTEGKLKLAARGQTVTLSPSSKTEFRGVEQASATVEFKLDGGKVSGFVLEPGNQVFTRKP